MKIQHSVKRLAAAVNVGTGLASLMFLVSLSGCDAPDSREVLEAEGAEEADEAEEVQSPPPPEPGADEPHLDEITAPLEPVAEGHSESSHHGLKCKNDWYNTLGRTKCTGAKGVKWRLKVACAWQGDYKGPWHTGPGSDGFECNIGVQSAGVIWG